MTYETIRALPPLRESDRALFALTKNANLLKPHRDEIEEFRRKIYAEQFGEAILTREEMHAHKNWKTYDGKWDDLMKMEVEIAEVTKLKWNELSLKLNPLPVNQLQEIEWLLEGQP